MTNTSLQHHGVLGMRWGFRKCRRTGKHRPTREVKAEAKARKRENRQGSNAKREARSQNVNNLTNKQLQERITRLNLEKQYNQLTARDKNRGREIVANVLTEAAKQVATNYVKQGMTSVVEAGFKSKAARVAGTRIRTAGTTARAVGTTARAVGTTARYFVGNRGRRR